MGLAWGIFGLLFFASLGATAAPCPEDTDAWKAWAKEEIARVWGTGLKNVELQKTAAHFQNCPPIPEAAKCLGPLKRFSTALSLTAQAGHSLGAKMSDEEYYAKVPYPEMLEVPKELQDARFLQWMDDNNADSLNSALKFIEDINAKIEKPEEKWISFIYQSQHLPTPDGTNALGRFFVFIPHKDFDRHLQFGLQNNPQGRLAHGLSVVAVQKTDPATGTPLPVPKARFKDFWRKRNDAHIEISTRLIENGKVENCYDCHKQAVLPITPDPKPFDKARFADAVQKVNGIMADYGAVEPEGYDRAAYGPGIGPEDSKLRTVEFLRGCANGRVKEERLPKIAEAMRCTTCHDNEQRGVLNFPSGRRRQPIAGTLVSEYVSRHRKMPLGEKSLSDDERAALVSCLSAEYYDGHDGKPGLLRAWLEQESCWNSLP